MKFRTTSLIVILILFPFIIPAHASELSDLIKKADAAFHADDYKTAAELYNKALKIDPMDYMAWLNLGFSLAELERYDESLKCYEKAVELGAEFVENVEPNSEAKAFYDEAMDYYKTGNYAKAVELFLKAMENDSSNGMILVNLGWCYRKVGNDNDAEKFFKKAIKRNPLYNGYAGLGRLYYDKLLVYKCKHYYSIKLLISPNLDPKKKEQLIERIKECQELLEKQQ